MPAVLDRPHAVVVELARPPQRRQMPGLASMDRALGDNRAGRAVDRGQRVAVLVRVRPDHVIYHRPFVGDH